MATKDIPPPTPSLGRSPGRAPWRFDADGPPCWLFDPASARIIMANRAGLALFGETSLLALSERRFAAGDPYIALAKAVLEERRPREASLDFGAGPARIALDLAELPDGRMGIVAFSASVGPNVAQDLAQSGAARRAAALDALTVPVLIANAGGDIYIANDAADALTPAGATSLAERLGAATARIVTDALVHHGHFSRSLNIGPDNATWRGHIEARRLRDPVDGAALDMIVLNDLRGLAAVEAAFDAERDGLKALINIAADFTWECSADGRLTQLSPAFETLTHIPVDAMIGQRWSAHSSYFDIEDEAEMIFDAAPATFEGLVLTLRQPHGDSLKLILSAHARHTAQGAFDGYRGIGRRARAPNEAADDTRGRRLLSLLHATDDALLVVDGEGRVRFANRAASELFSRPRETIETMLASSLFVPASRNALSETLASGDGGEATVRNAEGRDIAVSIHVRLLDASHPPTLCFVLRDLTQDKQRESGILAARDAALEESKQKSEFLARISHELRTPLNAIIGFSEIMRDGQFGHIDNARYVGYLHDIHHSAHLLLSLVNDLIDLSKIGAGGLSLKFSTVDVAQVLERCVSLLAPQAAQAGVTIETRLAPGLPALHADARSLEQIFLNLLSNAVKFTKPGGHVLASAALTNDGAVTLVVRDTGIGMSRDELAIALEPYKRVERPDVLSKPGTGIGLPLAKALAEANNAQFRIDSRPQAGTAVEIRFPKAKSA